jgi:hypothetical protein
MAPRTKQGAYIMFQIGKFNPYSLNFREAEQTTKAGLIEYYKIYGSFNPIIVVNDGEEYTIMDGHNRCAASIELGLKEISCIVIPSDIWSELEAKFPNADFMDICYAIYEIAEQSNCVYDQFGFSSQGEKIIKYLSENGGAQQ